MIGCDLGAEPSDLRGQCIGVEQDCRAHVSPGHVTR
jgi:hypothetical protein